MSSAVVTSHVCHRFLDLCSLVFVADNVIILVESLLRILLTLSLLRRFLLLHLLPLCVLNRILFKSGHIAGLGSIRTRITNMPLSLRDRGRLFIQAILLWIVSVSSVPVSVFVRLLSLDITMRTRRVGILRRWLLSLFCRARAASIFWLIFRSLIAFLTGVSGFFVVITFIPRLLWLLWLFLSSLRCWSLLWLIQRAARAARSLIRFPYTSIGRIWWLNGLLECRRSVNVTHNHIAGEDKLLMW